MLKQASRASYSAAKKRIIVGSRFITTTTSTPVRLASHNHTFSARITTTNSTYAVSYSTSSFPFNSILNQPCQKLNHQEKTLPHLRLISSSFPSPADVSPYIYHGMTRRYFHATARVQQQQQQSPNNHSEENSLETNEQTPKKPVTAASVRLYDAETTSTADEEQLKMLENQQHAAQSDQQAAPQSTMASMKAKVVGIYRLIHAFIKQLLVGTKQLYYNLKTMRELKKKEREGAKLTRRERRFIQTTKNDVKRAVPIIIIWRLPFTDVLMPFIILQFGKQGWLPSTFNNLVKHISVSEKIFNLRSKQSAILQQAKKKGNTDPGLRKAFEIARNYLLGMPPHYKYEHYPSKQETTVTATLSVDRIRDNHDLLERHFSLEPLTNEQLSALCIRLSVSRFGYFAFLKRSRIQKHMKNILEDDRHIHEEGVDTLDLKELVAANLERGLHVTEDSTTESLSRQLDAWVKLSIRYPRAMLPLLIWSHAFEVMDLEITPSLEALKQSSNNNHRASSSSDKD
eukprot:GEZU01018240.1.p1 GENE.GEZU01018240.1~~GEZU01018240.1.p1  ORF type:complete len:522 (-),score=101.54 GEZU01018240.1:26-1567(-)